MRDLPNAVSRLALALLLGSAIGFERQLHQKMAALRTNAAVHCYLVLAYSDADGVLVYVGFYYMANAAGRLLGTLLSGLVFEFAGFAACLWTSAALVLASALLAFKLPQDKTASLNMANTGSG